MRNILIFLFCLIIPALAVAQSRKDYKAAAIKKVTEYKSDLKLGKEKKIKAAETTYDSEGNETEVIEYDDFGKVSFHEKYTYNGNNDKTSVTEFDAGGKIRKVTKYTVNSNGDKLTAVEYDGAGKIKKTTKYTYYGEFKTVRETFDASNKLVSKKTYEYTR